jgi:hypothetical protein
VAEHPLEAEGEQRRQLVRVLRRRRVADQIDAAVELVESAGGKAPIDLVGAHPGAKQLPPRDDAVLASG